MVHCMSKEKWAVMRDWRAGTKEPVGIKPPCITAHRRCNGNRWFWIYRYSPKQGKQKKPPAAMLAVYPPLYSERQFRLLDFASNRRKVSSAGQGVKRKENAKKVVIRYSRTTTFPRHSFFAFSASFALASAPYLFKSFCSCAVGGRLALGLEGAAAFASGSGSASGSVPLGSIPS